MTLTPPRVSGARRHCASEAELEGFGGGASLALTVPTGVAVMPMRRVLGAYLTEARYETVRSLRMPIFAVPFLAIPTLLYLFFAVVVSTGERAERPENLPILLMTGFSVMGVMGPGIFGFGVSIAMERDQGLTRLKHAQPMPPAAYLVAKMVMASCSARSWPRPWARSACWCGAYRCRPVGWRPWSWWRASARCRS